MSKKTLEIIKKKHVVPEELKNRHKEYLHLRKRILETMKAGEATVPEVAEKAGIPVDQAFYMVMTLRKFGDIETGDKDESNEYYKYKLKVK